MSKKISYEKLYQLLDRKGETLSGLFRKGVLKDYPSRKILAGDYVSIEYIADLCRYLNVPIEDVVEVNQGELESPESE